MVVPKTPGPPPKPEPLIEQCFQALLKASFDYLHDMPQEKKENFIETLRYAFFSGVRMMITMHEEASNYMNQEGVSGFFAILKSFDSVKDEVEKYFDSSEKKGG